MIFLAFLDQLLQFFSPKLWAIIIFFSYILVENYSTPFRKFIKLKVSTLLWRLINQQRPRSRDLIRQLKQEEENTEIVINLCVNYESASLLAFVFVAETLKCSSAKTWNVIAWSRLFGLRACLILVRFKRVWEIYLKRWKNLVWKYAGWHRALNGMKVTFFIWY